MGMPPDAMGRLPQNPARPPRGGNSILSYWLKEPYYMGRWTYFHRPSLWNRMGGTRGFEWQGLYGFKSIGAGAGGIGYGGEGRAVPAAMKWVLRSGGGGLDLVGRSFTGVGGRLTTIGGRLTGRTFAAGRAPILGMGITDVGRGITRVGGGIRTFGGGFATGGLAGGARGLGLTRTAELTEQIFGGAVTGFGRFNFPVEAGVASRRLYATALRAGVQMTPTVVAAELLPMERVIQEAIGRGAGARHLLSGKARDRLTRRIVGGLTPEQKVLFAATGKVGQNAMTRNIMFRGGARLMSGVAVGVNIALFGGILANFAYSGARAVGEAAWNAQLNRRVPMLEFGRGYDPFAYHGARTERQRAVAAIQGSRLNARGFLGNEAALVHEGSF